MAAMPFLCRGVWFSPKLSYHRTVSLAIYLPIFYFGFCQTKYKILMSNNGNYIHCQTIILPLPAMLSLLVVSLCLRRMCNQNGMRFEGRQFNGDFLEYSFFMFINAITLIIVFHKQCGWRKKLYTVRIWIQDIFILDTFPLAYDISGVWCSFCKRGQHERFC